jgi:hypothetical protein
MCVRQFIFIRSFNLIRLPPQSTVALLRNLSFSRFVSSSGDTLVARLLLPCAVGILKILYNNLDLFLCMPFYSNIHLSPQRNGGQYDRLIGTIVEKIIGIYRFRKLIKGILFATFRSLIDCACLFLDFSSIGA